MSTRRMLLVGGILSSLLFAAMTVIFAIRWPGYSSASQTISELSAVGAPNRLQWERWGTLYTLLITGFGAGVWMAAGPRRIVRLLGGLILVYGALGSLWHFAPMSSREVLAAGAGTAADTMHLVLAGTTVLLMLAAIAVSASAFGKRFRAYALASLVTLFAFGALTFRDAPLVEANLPTPWIGVWERINVGVFLVWVIVIAVTLLRDRVTGTQSSHSQSIQTRSRRLVG